VGGTQLFLSALQGGEGGAAPKAWEGEVGTGNMPDLCIIAAVRGQRRVQREQRQMRRAVGAVMAEGPADRPRDIGEAFAWRLKRSA